MACTFAQGLIPSSHNGLSFMRTDHQKRSPRGRKIRLKRINILTIAIFLKKNKSMKINLNLDTFDLEDREN